MSGLPLVFGGAAFREEGGFVKPDDIEAVYKALEAGGVKKIDTATLYDESEQLLSETGAPKRFTIDTKTVGGFVPGSATKENVIKQGERSFELLGPVDIWYIHSPDYTHPLEDTLAGVQELYKKGFFKRFGLSNFKAEDVQKVYDLTKEKGWVVPTVYQGNYSAVARKQEELLFPTLRKLNIAFYAYSPLAGGFLTKTKQDITDGKGRFHKNSRLGEMYVALYARPALLEALAEWESIANEEGISRAELAYRWVSYNSPLSAKNGDAIIIGASSINQINTSVAGLKKGPLSDNAVKRIDQIWKSIEHEAPLDNIHA